jgi:tetratricopeptide (TPR) repeat protein
MNPLKKILISVLIIASLASIYFGAYKPLVKAQMYINTQKSIPAFSTFNELTSAFDRVFEFKSPIGQEEVVKFSNHQFESMISDKNQSEEVSFSVVTYAEEHIFEDNVVHLLQMGSMSRILFERFERIEYFQVSESYYKKVREIAPNLPHALYALFDLYQKTGQTEKMEEVGNKILELWPNEERVKEILNKVG